MILETTTPVKPSGIWKIPTEMPLFYAQCGRWLSCWNHESFSSTFSKAL